MADNSLKRVYFGTNWWVAADYWMLTHWGRDKMADFGWWHFQTLQGRHNECNVVSNHQHLDCLLHHLFRHRSKETSKLCITGLWEGNSLVTTEFSTQRASNVENVSIWWCHHDIVEPSHYLNQCWFDIYHKQYSSAISVLISRRLTFQKCSKSHNL